MIEFKKKKERHTISAHVSQDIISMLDYLMAVHGMTKSKIVEQILQHHMEMIVGNGEDIGVELEGGFEDEA